MNRFMIGWRALFRAWSDRDFAGKVGGLLGDETIAPEAVVPPAPTRSEALTLIAVLQREGRLVDFLQESIEGYSDAQIGAAVRDVHKGCAAALGRMLELRPVVEGAEGESFEVPLDADPLRYRLVGNVGGQPPFRGTLRHHGWQAVKCEIPTWSGASESTRVVAAAEVELA